MKKTELHPQIFLIEDFITDEECDHYIDLTQDKDFEEAKINVHGNQLMNKGVRNNDRLMVFDNDLAKNLFQRANEFLPQNHEDDKILDFNEMFRIYNILPDKDSKCIETEVISETKVRRAFILL